MLGYSMVATINMGPGYTTSHCWQWWACCTACPLYKCNFGRCGGLAGNVGLARRKLVPASPLLMVLACFPPRSTRTNKQKTKNFSKQRAQVYWPTSPKTKTRFEKIGDDMEDQQKMWLALTLTGRCPAMSFVSFLWQTQKNKTNGLSDAICSTRRQKPNCTHPLQRCGGKAKHCEDAGEPFPVQILLGTKPALSSHAREYWTYFGHVFQNIYPLKTWKPGCRCANYKEK